MNQLDEYLQNDIYKMVHRLGMIKIIEQFYFINTLITFEDKYKILISVMNVRKDYFNYCIDILKNKMFVNSLLNYYNINKHELFIQCIIKNHIHTYDNIYEYRPFKFNIPFIFQYHYGCPCGKLKRGKFEPKPKMTWWQKEFRRCSKNKYVK